MMTQKGGKGFDKGKGKGKGGKDGKGKGKGKGKGGKDAKNGKGGLAQDDDVSSEDSTPRSRKEGAKALAGFAPSGFSEHPAAGFGYQANNQGIQELAEAAAAANAANASGFSDAAGFGYQQTDDMPASSSGPALVNGAGPNDDPLTAAFQQHGGDPLRGAMDDAGGDPLRGAMDSSDDPLKAAMGNDGSGSFQSAVEEDPLRAGMDQFSADQSDPLRGAMDSHDDPLRAGMGTDTAPAQQSLAPQFGNVGQGGDPLGEAMNSGHEMGDPLAAAIGQPQAINGTTGMEPELSYSL